MYEGKETDNNTTTPNNAAAVQVRRVSQGVSLVANTFVPVCCLYGLAIVLPPPQILSANLVQRHK